MKRKKTYINNKIRAKEVRVVSDEKEHIGVIPLEKALEIAKKKDLDLVQITDNINPPVCKIIDYGKYSYEEKKKKKKQEKTHKTQVKSIRLGFSISEHDMRVRTKSAEKFLEEGDSVRIILPLRGRQKALEGVAREKMQQFLDIIQENMEIKIEKSIGKEPRGLTTTITKQ